MSTSCDTGTPDLTQIVVGMLVAIGLPLIITTYGPFTSVWVGKILRVSPQLAWHLSTALDDLGNVVLLLLFVRLLEQKGWQSVGIRRLCCSDLLLVGLAFALEQRIGVKVYRKSGLLLSLCGHWDEPVGGMPQGVDMIVMLANAALEELGSRAYLIERVLRFSGGLAMAGAVSIAISVAQHVPGHGMWGAVARAPMMSLFVGMYLWRRSFWVCFLLHFLRDIGIILAIHMPTVVVWILKGRGFWWTFTLAILLYLMISGQVTLNAKRLWRTPKDRA